MKRSLTIMIFTLAILVHAAGQSMGFLESWQIAVMNPQAPADYRGLLGMIGASDIVVKSVGLLFIVTMIGFLATIYGFYQGLKWWRQLITIMSVLSLAIFSLWWATIPVTNLAGALALNVIFLLAAYLWSNPIGATPTKRV
ncbi:MAG: hypothetical protein ACM3WQ_02345 [Chloroflexota bacterium]